MTENRVSKHTQLLSISNKYFKAHWTDEEPAKCGSVVHRTGCRQVELRAAGETTSDGTSVQPIYFSLTIVGKTCNLQGISEFELFFKALANLVTWPY